MVSCFYPWFKWNTRERRGEEPLYNLRSICPISTTSRSVSQGWFSSLILSQQKKIEPPPAAIDDDSDLPAYWPTPHLQINTNTPNRPQRDRFAREMFLNRSKIRSILFLDQSNNVFCWASVSSDMLSRWAFSAKRRGINSTPSSREWGLAPTSESKWETRYRCFEVSHITSSMVNLIPGIVLFNDDILLRSMLTVEWETNYFRFSDFGHTWSHCTYRYISRRPGRRTLLASKKI